jgi:hypothetical protein
MAVIRGLILCGKKINCMCLKISTQEMSGLVRGEENLVLRICQGFRRLERAESIVRKGYIYLLFYLFMYFLISHLLKDATSSRNYSASNGND